MDWHRAEGLMLSLGLLSPHFRERQPTRFEPYEALRWIQRLFNPWNLPALTSIVIISYNDHLRNTPMLLPTVSPSHLLPLTFSRPRQHSLTKVVQCLFPSSVPLTHLSRTPPNPILYYQTNTFDKPKISAAFIDNAPLNPNHYTRSTQIVIVYSIRHQSV
jgi:hypothetical protein